MPLSHSLNKSIGPLTRTIKDNATILQSIAGNLTNDVLQALWPYLEAEGIDAGAKENKDRRADIHFYDQINDEVANLMSIQRKWEPKLFLSITNKVFEANAITIAIIASEGALHHEWLRLKWGQYLLWPSNSKTTVCHGFDGTRNTIALNLKKILGKKFL